jgi:hypothetical protein
VNFRHGADGFFSGPDDSAVVLQVLVGQGAAAGVFEPAAIARAHLRHEPQRTRRAPALLPFPRAAISYCRWRSFRRPLRA